jgi:hypothetical protein
MRTRKDFIEFANFNCTFGNNKVLLDFADEIVLPALMGGETRKYGASTYLLLDPALVKLRDGGVGLVFEFVKDTIVDREQVLEEGALHDDYRNMPSAPSALVLLVLNNHRLVYLPKTKWAPTLGHLESTCKVLIERARKKLIAAELAELEPGYGEVATTRQTLEQKYPPVTLHIVPLTSALEVQSAVKKFEIIERLTITLVASNNEMDLDDFFKQFRKENEELGADTSKIQHSARKGLSSEATQAEVKAAGAQGQALIQVKGKDKEGQSLTQTNEDVRLRVEAGFEPSTPTGSALQMYDALSEVLEHGLVKTGRALHNVQEKVAALYRKYRRRQK